MPCRTDKPAHDASGEPIDIGWVLDPAAPAGATERRWRARGEGIAGGCVQHTAIESAELEGEDPVRHLVVRVRPRRRASAMLAVRAA